MVFKVKHMFCINKAHYICPYSNAIRGNIEVKLTTVIINTLFNCAAIYFTSKL
jgi:hypothetical protein